MATDPSSNDCTDRFVGVLRLLRLEAAAVMSLKACLDAPILPPRLREDFGVKKRVKDLGVIVGGLRCLLPGWLLDTGSTGEEVGSPISVDMALLDCKISCDPDGVIFSMTVRQWDIT